jgi:hypothetical protein
MEDCRHDYPLSLRAAIIGGMNTPRGRALRIALGAIAGLIAGAVAAVAIILVGAAVFWLYLFGDDPWPSLAETALVGTAYSAGALVFLAVMVSVARTR